ncbi:hypothetical protein GCM10027168_17240 [Streptomyces capparidis]
MTKRHAPSALVPVLAVLSVLLGTLALTAPPAQGRAGAADRAGAAAAQVLTWTADDDMTKYRSAPATAEAGPATIVFENSAATGNTTGMTHTLTFDTASPGHNTDVSLNILASPLDSSGGRHTAEVVLTPGTYRYFCAIPGHGTMSGVLTVTGGGEDTTPPQVTAAVTGRQDPGGAYLGSATVTLSATDAGSGVERVEYALDGGAYQPYTAPVAVHAVGDHTMAFRAADRAGNVSAVRSVAFTVVEPPAGDGTAPEVSAAVSGERDAAGRYVGVATVAVTATDGDSGVQRIQYSFNGGPYTAYTAPLTITRAGEHMVKYRATDRAGNTSRPRTVYFAVVAEEGYRTIFDGSAASFAAWEHVGGGAFAPNGDGSMTSSATVPGMGMLWYPVRAYGDFSLKLQFRDEAPGEGRANSGVFVRFPGVHGHPEESRPEWVAIKYGHEVQILDRPDGDAYKTGSVYGFSRVGLDGAGVTPKGAWNTYEVRVIGQRYSVYRNGVLLNEFDNTPGLVFSPPRADDPGTDGRQAAQGYIGLQTHGTTDVVSFRNVRVREL